MVRCAFLELTNLPTERPAQLANGCAQSDLNTDAGRQPCVNGAGRAARELLICLLDDWRLAEIGRSSPSEAARRISAGIHCAEKLRRR